MSSSCSHKSARSHKKPNRSYATSYNPLHFTTQRMSSLLRIGVQLFASFAPSVALRNVVFIVLQVLNITFPGDAHLLNDYPLSNATGVSGTLTYILRFNTRWELLWADCSVDHAHSADVHHGSRLPSRHKSAHDSNRMGDFGMRTRRTPTSNIPATRSSVETDTMWAIQPNRRHVLERVGVIFRGGWSQYLPLIFGFSVLRTRSSPMILINSQSTRFKDLYSTHLSCVLSLGLSG